MRRVIVCVTVALLLGQLISSVSLAQPTSTQTTSFIDIGQGDSVLIQDGTGFDVLIDGGVAAEGSTVIQFLKSHEATDLEVMLASHADADHIGGLIAVLKDPGITTHQVLYNGYPGASATWDSFVAAAGARGLTLTTAQFPAELAWGKMNAYVLNPSSGLSNPETNDTSLVVRVDYGTVRELFTGDIDSTIEATVVARQTPVAADILKVAHHGSAYSSSDPFLATVHPEVAVISVGANSYGHPSILTIARLQLAGADVDRTDQLGNISVSSDGITFTLSPLSPSDVFLPIIMNPATTPPPPEPTSTPPPEATPITPPGPVASGNIVITSIFFDGVLGSTEPDEYVEIANQDMRAIQLQYWSLSDVQSHVFTFPAFVMEPGKVCRVYTNQNHPEWCSFSYGSGSAIWNNSGDTATLKDAGGQVISQKAY
ncbi:MAG: lamin tail domain-containing protein [Anaerolineaceae bacterium]|nr:lamin tail domain-containing protein [Anaerolineaceae bacterium]